jgi:hypothetical protein
MLREGFKRAMNIGERRLHVEVEYLSLGHAQKLFILHAPIMSYERH